MKRILIASKPPTNLKWVTSREEKKKYKSDQQKSDSSFSLNHFIYTHKTTERWKTFRACLLVEIFFEQLYWSSYSVLSRKNRADAEEARATSNYSNFRGRDPRWKRAKNSSTEVVVRRLEASLQWASEENRWEANYRSFYILLYVVLYIYLYLPPPALYLTISLSIYRLLYVVYIYLYIPIYSGSSKSIHCFAIHLQRSSRWLWKSTRILKSVSVKGLSRPLKSYRLCMLALNAGQPTSSSRNCGIDPLEKQDKERRKEVGLEKPSLLLLLLLLPDGISIRTMLGTDVVYISLSNYSCIYLLSKWRSTTFTYLESHIYPEDKLLDSLNDPELSRNKDRVTHSLTYTVRLRIKSWI